MGKIDQLPLYLDHLFAQVALEADTMDETRSWSRLLGLLKAAQKKQRIVSVEITEVAVVTLEPDFQQYCLSPPPAADRLDNNFTAPINGAARRTPSVHGGEIPI